MEFLESSQEREASVTAEVIKAEVLANETFSMCYALLRMRPLSIPCAECSVVISCGKVDYDKSG
jgi:hypothetical protein